LDKKGTTKRGKGSRYIKGRDCPQSHCYYKVIREQHLEENQQRNSKEASKQLNNSLSAVVTRTQQAASKRTLFFFRSSTVYATKNPGRLTVHSTIRHIHSFI
jgi:hypothetical protein